MVKKIHLWPRKELYVINNNKGAIPFCLGYKNRKNLKTKTYLDARDITLQQHFSSMVCNCFNERGISL